MTDNLKLDVVELQGDTIDDPLQDLYDNLKSPDRSKSWKGARLRRSKTYSGSPSNRLGNENAQAVANKSKNSDGPVPLSPVNQKKWNKTNMKRRSSNAAQQRGKSFSERRDSAWVGVDCQALSKLKIEVRHSSDISNNAVMHKYSCPCKQYLDESTGIIYKLQVHQSFDSNLIDDCDKVWSKENSLTPIDILNSSIMEEDPQQIHTSTPILGVEHIQTFAENTKAENIAVTEFNFDFQLLDDTIIELQTIRSEIREAVLKEVWSADNDRDSCCKQISVDKRKISSSILQSMSDSEGRVVYLLISVFSYLDLDSIYQAGRVCRTWHCASQHPAVWRNVTIRDKVLGRQALHNLSLTCVSTQQLRISHCTLINTPSVEEELRKLYVSMGGSLKALYLTSNTDSNMLLDTALVHCTSLTRLHLDNKVTERHLTSVSDAFSQLTCLRISDTKGFNTTQFYELESVKCFSFNAAGLRVDEIQNIIEWFPNVCNVHLRNGSSLHSSHVKNLFNCDTLLNLSFTDTYLTPRAILYLLCTCRALKTLHIKYSSTFTDKKTFEESYRTAIQAITDNVLFDSVLQISFSPPTKPTRSVHSPELP